MGISEQTAGELGASVVRLVKLFSAMRQHAPKIHPGADVAAYPIMFWLSQGPRRVSSLADAIHSDVSTVSRQVSGLAAHGLVTKLSDPDDRRASILSLTDEGRSVVDRLHEQRIRWFQDMLDDWDPDDIETLRTLLERFSAAVEGSKDGLLEMHRDPAAAKI